MLRVCPFKIKSKPSNVAVSVLKTAPDQHGQLLGQIFTRGNVRLATWVRARTLSSVRCACTTSGRSCKDCYLSCLFVCGESFTADHALTCSHGGYLGMWHNEVRELMGHLLDESCPNVSLEPALQPLTGEILLPSANKAQAKFYPHARSHCHRSLPQICRSQEMEKRRQERILNVDRGTFTPLVFGMLQVLF